MVQALDGKNVKDILLNVGSGGGAAAAPAAGGASGGAAGGADAPAEAAEEKKEEGWAPLSELHYMLEGISLTLCDFRKGGVRRGHGFRPFRLSVLISVLVLSSTVLAGHCARVKFKYFDMN